MKKFLPIALICIATALEFPLYSHLGIYVLMGGMPALSGSGGWEGITISGYEVAWLLPPLIAIVFHIAAIVQAVKHNPTNALKCWLLSLGMIGGGFWLISLIENAPVSRIH